MSKARDTADWGQFKPVRKNLIINGDFKVWQRGVSFVPMAVNAVSTDRFKYTGSTTAVLSVNKLGSSSAPFDAAQYLRFDVTTADAAIAAGDFAGMVYDVEGYDAGYLRYGISIAKTITISFWTAHTKTGIYCVKFGNGTADRSYIAEYTQVANGSWEKQTITIPGDVAGTWAVDNSIGMRIFFAFAVGSNFTTTANSWSTSNTLGTANQVNALDNTANFMRFGNIQLEIGSEATEFEHRSFADELVMCQRYFEKSFNINTAPADGTGDTPAQGNGVAILSANIYVNTINFKVRKRATPTMTYYSGNVAGAIAGRWSYWNGAWFQPTTATVTQYANEHSVAPRLDGITSTVNNSWLLNGQWTADSEL